MITRPIVLLVCAVLLIAPTASAQDDGVLQVVFVPDLPPDQLAYVPPDEVADWLTWRLEEQQAEGALEWFEVVQQADHRTSLTMNVQDANRLPDILYYLTDWWDVELLPSDEPPKLLEFVDFSGFQPGEIPDGTCLLTTAQVAQAIAEGNVPASLEDFTCPPLDPEGEPETALLHPEGTPFVTLMTGAGVSDAQIARSAGSSDWAVNVLFDPQADQMSALVDYITGHELELLAVVYDGRLVTAPILYPHFAQTVAVSGLRETVISGNFSKQQAQDIANQFARRTTVELRLRIERLQYGPPAE